MIEFTNEEYEKGLLGCIIHNPSIVQDHRIKADLFTGTKRLHIFASIGKIVQSGDVLNIRALVGSAGPALAADIAELTDRVGNVTFLVQELKKLYQKRELVKIAQNIMDTIKGSSDPDDAIAGIESSLGNMAEGRSYQYQKVADFLPAVIGQIGESIGGTNQGILTGLDGIDRITNGFSPEEYVIIGARPGTGKTSIVLNMTLNMLEQKKRIGIFSSEMSKELITKRMLCTLADVDGRKLRAGMLTAHDLSKFMVAAESLYAGEVYVNDTPNIHMGALISEAKRMHRNNGVEIIFVDYMSLIACPNTDAPRHEQVAQLSRTFKQLARELHIPIVVLVQVNRDAQDKRPSMANLRESGAIEQDSDIIMLMWNQGWSDKDPSKVKITMIVEKNRNGATGDVDLLFRPDVTRFYENISCH